MEAVNQNLFQQLLNTARWQLRSLDELKNTSFLTKLNYTNFFLFIFFVVFAIYQMRSRLAANEARIKRYITAPDFPDIESLPDFEWESTEPLKQRPFKSKYHLTMALQKLDPSELILMDKNYKDRITYRKGIMDRYHDSALAVSNDSRIGSAVRELYTFIMGTYLPKRYPRMFKLHQAHFETGDSYMLENLVTRELLPAEASQYSKTITLLEILGRTVDEEFLFLLPEEAVSENADPKYVLEAYVTISPSGFDTKEKLGKRLADIHAPVPGYKKIIEGSMDRYFAKVKVGEYSRRANWTITTNSELFIPPWLGANHASEGEETQILETIDPVKTWLRSERQTLHRLPKSKALVFAFKTYMTPLSDVKDEGFGEELAQAIDGLKEGNVPQMHHYKRGAVWGEAVKKYLRS